MFRRTKSATQVSPASAVKSAPERPAKSGSAKSGSAKAGPAKNGSASKAPAAEAAAGTGPKGKVGGKGRPTPKRKEAEAARKAALRKPRNRREAAQVRRQKMREERVRVQQAMETGDDRYLPQADKGPVRRFARDYVDARWTVMEFIMPVLLVVAFGGLIMSYAVPALAVLINLVFLVAIVTIAFDWWLLVRGLKKKLAERMPDAETRGVGFYAIRRTMQMRRWRLPKPMVKRGEKI